MGFNVIDHDLKTIEEIPSDGNFLFDGNDYENMDPINRISTQDGTWKADRNCDIYVCISITGNGLGSGSALLNSYCAIDDFNIIRETAYMVYPFTGERVLFRKKLRVLEGQTIKLRTSDASDQYYTTEYACHIIPIIYAPAHILADGIEIVNETGQATDKVMSQKAVTDIFSTIADYKGIIDTSTDINALGSPYRSESGWWMLAGFTVAAGQGWPDTLVGKAITGILEVLAVNIPSAIGRRRLSLYGEGVWEQYATLSGGFGYWARLDSTREVITIDLLGTNVTLEKKNGVVHMRSAAITVPGQLNTGYIDTLPVGWRPSAYGILRGLPNTTVYDLYTITIDSNGDMTNNRVIPAGTTVVWLDTTWITEE